MLHVAVMVALIVVAGGVMMFAGVAVGRHQAQNAADLAALAAAQAEGRDSPEGPAPCSLASRIAQLNEAVVTGCEVIGSPSDFVVTVRVHVTLRLHFPGLPAVVSAEANAGPIR